MGDQQPGGKENRRAPRSKLFLAASIEAEGIKAPVRIRNLSETGALLEGPALPPTGTLIMLKRQDVEIAAEVIWLAASQGGVRFQGRISVSEWIAGKRAPATFGQARVDSIQAAVRSGAALGSLEAAENVEEQDPTNSDERLAQEISYVQRLLEQVSSELIQDIAVVQRHERIMQNFDIADQILGHLAKILTATDRDEAIRSIGMEELRARLLKRSI